MKFSELAQYFEKLEETSSRLALIDILSELFKKAPKDEIGKIIYLTQGRIAPFFEATEIGMSEKLVAQAIGRTYDTSKEAVLKLYGKVGDMGLSIEKLEEKSKVKESKISVDEVFQVLTQIAKTKGEGTVEKRLNLLSELLKKADSISAKYIVRIPLGNLRLGIGDPTVLDGLAKAFLGDKGKRKLLEGAYNRTSDLGLIGQTLVSKGLGAVQDLKVTVGKPIRSELCERLPTPEKVIEKLKVVNSQYKYDGFRVQIHKMGKTVKMFSRNLEDMTHMFPELIEGTLKQV
ncbi:MAG TPA: DNA ligase, partial [Patescibacteria group bacterium]|nr:DNA ligase [Patescibacteria group bacterium]